MKKAVFIDKDGTLINDVPYNIDPDLVQVQNDAGKALKSLKENKYLLVVISNQSGVAKGYFLESDIADVSEEIQRQLLKDDVQLDAFYYCPHSGEGVVAAYAVDCDCRKPKPGLILKAAGDLDIDLSQSWMIGDILNDVEAGKAAGCSTILIDNGNETEWIINENRTPDFKAKNLQEACEIINDEDKITGERHEQSMAKM